MSGVGISASGNDWLGLGAIGTAFGGINKGTEKCGAKPTCIGITKACRDKQSMYNECVMKSLDVDQTYANANLRNADSNALNAGITEQSKFKTIAILGAVVVVVMIVVLVITRKSN